MNDQEMIQRVGTLFYLYDISELKNRVDMMRSHQTGIGLCFAMKASPVLAKYAAPFVDRLEVCSPGEYEICIRDGVESNKILVSGVNKTCDSISRILTLGGAAGLFTIESPKHYEILEDAARRYATEKNSDDPLRCYIRLTSGNQFGVDRATLETLAEKVIASPYLELVGIHYFSGTQKNLKKIEKELTELTDYGAVLRQKYGREFSLEYGPGLGIDYFVSRDKSKEKTEDKIEKKSEDIPEEGSDIKLSYIGEDELVGLMELVEKTGIRNSFSDITFEYGRYIAATSGRYFTGVNDVKENDGNHYAILDGGIHQLTYYGSMVGMKVPYINLIPAQGKSDEEKSGEGKPDEGEGKPGEDKNQDYCLAGSLCSVNDILVRRITFPRLDIGDTLCFNLTGAYCATEGIALFLSRDLPAIVVKDMDGNESIVRDHIEINSFNGG